MKVGYCSLTDKGVTRNHNEDFFLNSSRFSLFMVADGMGGYQCGDYASQLGLNSVLSYLESCTKGGGDFSERTFRFAIDYANTCIFNYRKRNPQIKNMGTTFISFMHSNQGGAVYHIGDSRLYRLRQNKLTQLTKDHSAESEVLPEFMQNANEGKYSSVLTRALGTNESVSADTLSFDYMQNDILLLCTDGLYSMVPDQEIVQILSKPGTLKQKASDLIAKANENGGEDNVTATLVEILSESETAKFEMVEAE